MTELLLPIVAVFSALGLVLLVLIWLKWGAYSNDGRRIQDRFDQFDTRFSDLMNAIGQQGRLGRDELRDTLLANQNGLDGRIANFGQQQLDQLSGMRKEASDGRSALEQAMKRNSDAFSEAQITRLAETNRSMKELAERLEKAHTEARLSQTVGLEAINKQVAALIESNSQKQDAIRESLTSNLEQLRKDNEAKLEQMRITVDEKLHGTLEKRLGESFQIVSDRLELVHKGLGEMQTLANGVGDLKRVLTNVKTRGTWGEVQLGMLLEDLLTVDQYAKNVRIRPESGETVEFAVRLPGSSDTPLYLPIDAKFPQEDYERLQQAHDLGIPDEIERAASSLEKAVRTQAKIVCEKYIHPPHSTDFAILYLPTEGLFAEVIRRPGLSADIQAKYRVMLAGPTTLAALLTSLQMGFRTLAIEKRSSEVWQVLGAAKAEFRKYGDVWDKLGKQLDTAKKTVDDAGRRTRAVERSLRGVETVELPTGEAQSQLEAAESREILGEILVPA